MKIKELLWNNIFLIHLVSSQGLTCCRTCRARRGAVTLCLPVQTTASSSRQEASTAASTRSSPSTWTHDGHTEAKKKLNQSLCFTCGLSVYDVWRETITAIYCIFKAGVGRIVLILNRCENMSVGVFDCTNRSAWLTRSRAAGKLANMNGQKWKSGEIWM